MTTVQNPTKEDIKILAESGVIGTEIEITPVKAKVTKKIFDALCEVVLTEKKQFYDENSPL